MMFPSSIIVGVTALAVGTAATAVMPRTSASSGAAATASASITSSAGSSSTTSSAITTHTIAVGANGFKFQPTTTNASVGDIIEWRFYPTGHWVVRSAFGQPCIPYEDTGPNLVGFSSGPQDVETTSDDGPTFQVRVNDTEPIFFYCAASGSCDKYHMVGVINPTVNETYEMQYEYAENVTYQMTPGEAFPSETADSTASSATATSGASSDGSSSSSSSGSGHKGLSGGAIAGISIGAAAVVVFAVALIYLFGRRSGTNRAFGGVGPSGSVIDPYGGGPMQDAKYGGPAGPKSPGQDTFTSAGYSTAPSVDPYQQMHMGQYGNGIGYPASTGSPPPMSEYSQSLYQQHYGSVPQLGVDGASHHQPTTQYQTHQPLPPPPQDQQSAAYNAPVELPTSLNPGNSPLPQYNNPAGTYSWGQSSEGTYRPSKPL
ncbi:hypothetical protein M406DRAFT_347569 [Cryphonectria parasitica EP155]|uniref:Extracellular serine-rich protein n=1 Tax=Cryphonectria parasitica (strain ATCC 38755 / EP155) TaxID=660469 RepID=A0A9P5CKS3_CRYP1|nr:uncharacterized protein M406DRAFT_347569 [Cryphonectria parasitica EP155]KAF3762559.1 hypothetical protein M406DRAFT_347569 [Cryphonectria parasitica EP155]